jgi:hypothetical protein
LVLHAGKPTEYFTLISTYPAHVKGQFARTDPHDQSFSFHAILKGIKLRSIGPGNGSLPLGLPLVAVPRKQAHHNAE